MDLQEELENSCEEKIRIGKNLIERLIVMCNIFASRLLGLIYGVFPGFPEGQNKHPKWGIYFSMCLRVLSIKFVKL